MDQHIAATSDCHATYAGLEVAVRVTLHAITRNSFYPEIAYIH